MSSNLSVDNIFKLVNKFTGKENTLSANFGFILKNNKKILSAFLRKIKVPIESKRLQQVDIQTQATYDSSESIIDLQLLIPSYLPNNFICFLESKVVSTKSESMGSQLKKYRQVLKKSNYEKIRLVWVNKKPVSKKEKVNLQKHLQLDNNEFYIFSWQDLLDLTKPFEHKELIKLFNQYIGDSMHNKQIIGNQQIKNIPEVLVIFTSEERGFWELSKKKNIAVQKTTAPNAQYIAFLRTHRSDGKKSAITHIAKVKSVESETPVKENYAGISKLIKEAHSKNYWDDTHKRYNLEKIVPLAHEIVHNSNKGMVKFQTTFSELMQAKTTKDIKAGFIKEKH